MSMQNNLPDEAGRLPAETLDGILVKRSRKLQKIKREKEKNMKIKDLKIGEYFTIKPLENPKENQVYIRGEYDRTDKKYCCGRFDDISYSRLFDGNKEVYTEFTF